MVAGLPNRSAEYLNVTGRIKNASVSHYALNRTTGISPGVEADRDTAQHHAHERVQGCHNVNGGPYGVYGPDYDNVRDIAPGHNDMGSTPVRDHLMYFNNNMTHDEIK